MAYLVISVANATAAQKDAITTFLGTLGAYWHWMPEIWLANTESIVGCTDVRDFIFKKMPAVQCIVLEVEPRGADPWPGAFAAADANQMAEWLQEYWKPVA